jgi:hypothetical protein
VHYNNMVHPIHNFQVSLATLELIPRKRIYTVWVVASDDGSWKIYHCPDCRNAMFQYKGDLVAEIPGEAPQHYPVMIQCRNPNCGRKVIVADAIKQLEQVL